MGEAATATADDATALYWNPGALVRLEGQSATFMHAATIENSSFEYVAYARHLHPSAFGASFQYFSAGAVDETDLSGNKTGSLTPNDMALTGGYAQTVKGYGVGISAKYIQSSLVDTARTFALDGGILTPTFWKDRMRAGASLTNLGGKIKFDQESASLPITVKGGVEIIPWKGWTGGVDLVAPKGEDTHFALGAEYQFTLGKDLSLSLRGGYNSRSSANGQAEGLSAGLGFEWNRLGVDYAFINHGDLDPSQVLSIRYGF